MASGATAPSFLGAGRQPGHQVQAVTSQGQHSFCSLEITHLPPPSYSFCSLAGVRPLSGPEGVDGSAPGALPLLCLLLPWRKH